MLHYSREEILKHNVLYDCWLISKNKVYNVSGYATKHPGGVYAIELWAGGDVTDSYNYHTNNAKKMWEKFLIGTTDPIEIKPWWHVFNIFDIFDIFKKIKDSNYLIH
jgi:cytochrome b involved in lipid metabolism